MDVSKNRMASTEVMRVDGCVAVDLFCDDKLYWKKGEKERERSVWVKKRTRTSIQFRCMLGNMPMLMNFIYL
jgi:hypothetical protein